MLSRILLLILSLIFYVIFSIALLSHLVLPLRLRWQRCCCYCALLFRAKRDLRERLHRLNFIYDINAATSLVFEFAFFALAFSVYYTFLTCCYYCTILTFYTYSFFWDDNKRLQITSSVSLSLIGILLAVVKTISVYALLSLLSLLWLLHNFCAFVIFRRACIYAILRCFIYLSSVFLAACCLQSISFYQVRRSCSTPFHN